MSAALSEVTYGDVKESIEVAKGHLEQAAEQIVWQIENRVWNLLGYADWNEMRETEYGGAAFMVPKAERPELVARMRSQGLTHQEIAATAGVSDETVRRDLQTKNVGSAPVTNARGQQRPSTYQRREPTRTVEADVAEFPDLAHYVETGQSRDVAPMADDLRRFRARGELEERLGTLRRSIALDKAKRDGTYVPAAAPVNTETGEVASDYNPQTTSVETEATTGGGASAVDDAEAAPGEEVEALPATPSRPAISANHCPTCTCIQGDD